MTPAVIITMFISCPFDWSLWRIRSACYPSDHPAGISSHCHWRRVIDIWDDGLPVVSAGAPAIKLRTNPGRFGIPILRRPRGGTAKNRNPARAKWSLGFSAFEMTGLGPLDDPWRYGLPDAGRRRHAPLAPRCAFPTRRGFRPQWGILGSSASFRSRRREPVILVGAVHPCPPCGRESGSRRCRGSPPSWACSIRLVLGGTDSAPRFPRPRSCPRRCGNPRDDSDRFPVDGLRLSGAGRHAWCRQRAHPPNGIPRLRRPCRIGCPSAVLPGLRMAASSTAG